MRKILYFSLALTLVCIFSLPQGAIAKDKPIKWKMSTCWVSSNDFINHDKYFVKLVHEMAGGRLQIKFHSGGEIVPATELLPAVQNNVLQAGGDWAGFWIGRDTAFNILAGFPMAPDPFIYLAWIYANGGLEVFNEIYGKHGVVYFPHCAMGPESGIRSRPGAKGFETLEDFKGAKIRIAGRIQGYVMDKLNAAPVNVTPAEIYQALERGLLDHAEYSMPHSDWSLAFQEVTSEWSVPGWYQTGFTNGIMINKKAWEELPEDLKAIVRYAAQATMCWAAGRGQILAGEYTKKFLDRGANLHVLDAPSLNEIEKIAYEGLLKEAQANPLYAKAAYLLYDTARKTQPYKDIGERPLTQRDVSFPDMKGLKKSAGSLMKD